MASPIEHFVTRSFGVWTAQRSGHNLAFRHVEEVESEICIAPVAPEDPRLMELLASNHVEADAMCCPFSVTWQGTSDWDENATSEGSCLLAPVPASDTTGRLLRSQGYTETIPAVGQYRFSDDGAFVLVTPYERASAEERVWFATDDLRLRVALMRTSSGRGVLQASFSSEIRKRSA
ncbi:MAG TPA: phycobiliprotein lyase [Synechococcus sp. UBA8638]|nr:phycobiliprotein lyase [Synechococcus sp. UBA8638]